MAESKYKPDISDVELVNSQYTLERMMNYFSIDFLPDVYNAPGQYIAYVIFTGPDLYLYNNGVIRNEIEHLSDLYALLISPTGKIVGPSLDRNSKTPFLPYFSQRLKNFPISNADIKISEVKNSYYNHGVKYPRFSEDHRKGGNIGLSFAEDADRSVGTAVAIWLKTIHYLTKTRMLAPYKTSITKKTLETVGSATVLITKMDGRELVYWDKWFGIFPSEDDAQAFNFDKKIIMNEESSINFEYSIKARSYDLRILAALNALTKDKVGSKFKEYSSMYDMRFEQSYGPYITSDGKGRFFLNWV